MKIVIATCDAYRKVWIGMEHALRKYWSDRPWPVVAITNGRDVPFADETIKVGPEQFWYGYSDKMMAGLDQIEDEYILYLQDDNWFFTQVKTFFVQAAYNLMVKRDDLNMIRLVHLRKSYGDPVAPSIDGLINHVPVGARGRANIQATIWKKQTFRDLFIAGESAHNFDCNASARCTHLGGFARLKEPRVMVYDDSRIVLKGCWGENAEAYCRREGIEIPGLKVGVPVLSGKQK